MKTVNMIIKESAVGNLSNTYKYAILCLFSGIIATIFALFVCMLGHIDYVSSQFAF